MVSRKSEDWLLSGGNTHTCGVRSVSRSRLCLPIALPHKKGTSEGSLFVEVRAEQAMS